MMDCEGMFVFCILKVVFLCVDDQSNDSQNGGDPFAWTGGGGNGVPTASGEGVLVPPSLADDDDDEGSGDGGGDADSGVSSQQDDECLMTPSQRLDKYALSNNILYR